MSIFTAILLSHNIPVSKKSPCTVLTLQWSGVESVPPLWSTSNEAQDVKTEECHRVVLVELRRRRGDNDLAYRVEIGPWTAGTTGMYCAIQ